jgi:voltage-gated potassium channel
MQSNKEKLFHIIFGTDTKAGKMFDVILLWLIISSVLIVLLESIESLNQRFDREFFILEVIFTSIFTIEYFLRIWVVRDKKKYIKSYYGIIDLMGIAPFYLGLIFLNYHFFMVFRLLRLLRVFRILRLFRFIEESDQLFTALKASIYKIIVFFSSVLTIVILLGTLMYVVEGPNNGFTSIPQSIYWTIVTITTVGYGDITPQTDIGKWIASVIMLCGYAIIAIPTGIVTVELAKNAGNPNKKCSRCSEPNTAAANYCQRCGNKFSEE